MSGLPPAGPAPDSPPPSPEGRQDRRGRFGDAVRFGRDHAAVLVLALVVMIGLAITQATRARTTTLPIDAGPVSATGPSEAESAASAAQASSQVATTGAQGSPTPASAATTVVVQVLGEVRRPGVVELPAGSRIADAVTACGGLTSRGDPGELNFAAVLQDADQVIIGTAASPRGEVRHGLQAGPSTGGGAAGVAGGSSSDAPAASTGGAGEPMDLNQATAEQLDQIPGVGPVTAERILSWRSEHGRFTSVEQLQEIDGIGPKTYARIAPYVRV